MWWSLAFVAGIAWVQQLTRLPDVPEALALCALTFTFGRTRLGLRHWGCALLSAILWASLFGHWRLAQRLDAQWEGRDVRIEGYIADLPRIDQHRISFEFAVLKAAPGIPGKIRLSWYEPTPLLKGGQSWALTVRLKAPHGRSNPGGFDYEAWLFANGIDATGYVRTNPTAAHVTSPPFSPTRTLAAWRQRISDNLDLAMPAEAGLGIVKALTIGDQQQIDRPQWQLFRRTGVIHLMVISGAHVSLIAGLVFWAAGRAAAWLGPGKLAPPAIAAAAAWSAALLYAGLAGLTIPVQRALVMLSIALLALAWQRHSSASRTLCLALVAVTAFDPLAVISPGFWLSFAAVACLLYISGGRLVPDSAWRRAVTLHIAMAAGLTPLLILFFQQTSLIAPIANALAVPLVGLIVTPVALSAAALGLLSSELAGVLLWPLGFIINGLCDALNLLATIPAASVSLPAPSSFALACALAGVALALAPRGLPGRHWCAVFCLPLLFPTRDLPQHGDFRLSVLDVGQGLSAVLETSEHVLVFDTGPRFSEQADMGESVVLPYLRYRGIRRIDTLIVSHADNDHSGGTASLLAEMPVDTIYSSAPYWAKQQRGRYCRAGQQWEWNGIGFRMLGPPEHPFASENDNSCVLQINGPHFGVLFSGDIERAAEDSLTSGYGGSLASTILIAPHHGSKTSSSPAFLQQIKPAWVLIPAGHANRFGFPHPAVNARYQQLGASVLITGRSGAIVASVTGNHLDMQTWRASQRRYWLSPP
ncbi:DNA internalization-related competence protein ComEC/Rec2 [Methylomonas sp. HYX-M1]|uniref:DNA internalization-related competence protein ComEC/Rec2 n=1 Tax=Methylomonas sp. HYX-M1 TaxID=3139307 RepID=UPI00345C5F68